MSPVNVPTVKKRESGEMQALHDEGRMDVKPSKKWTGCETRVRVVLNLFDGDCGQLVTLHVPNRNQGI